MPVLTTLPYKILLVKECGYIYSKGYRLYEHYLSTGESCYIGSIPDVKYGLLAKFKLTRRFFRAEITGLYQLADGSLIVIAKKGLFKLSPGASCFVKRFSTPRGSKPLNLCVLPNGHIYFGEYFMNMEKKNLYVYCSVDNGDTWEVAYTFEEGNINHIHGLFYDKYTGRIWCLTGDRENECIIGYTENEFKSFVEVFRGGQEYRACNLFFYPDYFVYATDSQYMKNTIKTVNRRTIEIISVQEIQGSAIKGRQVGDTSMLSTTVEPSDINLDKHSYLWVSSDGVQWSQVFVAKKDCLPAIMQFGTFEFPNYANDKQALKSLVVSGRALTKYDGKSIVISNDN